MTSAGSTATAAHTRVSSVRIRATASAMLETMSATYRTNMYGVSLSLPGRSRRWIRATPAKPIAAMPRAMPSRTSSRMVVCSMGVIAGPLIGVRKGSSARDGSSSAGRRLLTCDPRRSRAQPVLPGGTELPGQGNGGGDHGAAVDRAFDAELAVQGGEPVRQPGEAAAVALGASDAVVADVDDERAV